MASLAAVEQEPRRSGVPEWIAPSLQTKAGRDPLGLMTITQDRIMPILMPGILAQSNRARYFSFHPFLLDEFERRGLTPSSQALSDFIKHREFELACAVQFCPNGCGKSASGAIGTIAAQSWLSRHRDEAVARRESVESHLGGYGANYRAPLIDLGVVVPKGTPYGAGDDAKPTPVDVLRRDDRARGLAASYRTAIENTAYYRDWFVGDEAIPRDVLRDFAICGCLCRLKSAPDEQRLVHELLFTIPAGDQPDFVARDVDQRRRSFALFLREADQAPGVVSGDGSLHQAIWDDFTANVGSSDGPLAETLGQWAALVAKDYLQDGLSGIFDHFWRLGLAYGNPDGPAPSQLDELISGPLLISRPLRIENREILLDPTESARAFVARLAEETRDIPLTTLRGLVVSEPSGATGLLLLLAIITRLPDPDEPAGGWREIGSRSSERQPSILLFAHLLESCLEGEPSLAEMFTWLVRRFVVGAHEQVAYSKLPDFTFRFRWENGRLRFYNIGQGRFDLADVRRTSMSRITEDIGMWQRDGEVALTEAGRAFVAEVFG